MPSWMVGQLESWEEAHRADLEKEALENESQLKAGAAPREQLLFGEVSSRTNCSPGN